MKIPGHWAQYQLPVFYIPTLISHLQTNFDASLCISKQFVRLSNFSQPVLKALGDQVYGIPGFQETVQST
jgi:hypothetical protein